MNTYLQSIYRSILFLIAFLILPTLSWAALLDLSKAPLFLGISMVPNVFIELDDSGSMDWEILTKQYWSYCAYDKDAYGSTGSTNCGSLVENGLWRGYTGSFFTDFEYLFNSSDNVYSRICSDDNSNGNVVELCSAQTASADWRLKSSALNILYYSPSTTYKLWDESLGNGNFTSARSNPQSGSTGYGIQRNLTGFVYEVWIDDKGYRVSDGRPRRGTNINFTTVANGMVDLWDSHFRVTVNSDHMLLQKITCNPSSNGALNCNPVSSYKPSTPYSQVQTGVYRVTTLPPELGGRSLASEQTNIANWYQYARRRTLLTKGAIAQVVQEQPNFRYGLSVINESTQLFVEVAQPNQAGAYDFITHNDTLLQTLYKHPQKAFGTPLRGGLERTGNYFANLLSGKANPITQECQQNFTLLMSDGYWNGAAPSSSIGDADLDTKQITLADVAKHYYARDLSTLPNNVIPTDADPATHQHMVTFTVALGIAGNLKDNNEDGWPDPPVPVPPASPWGKENANWGDPIGGCSDAGDCPERLDDMWHAAYNSRGSFFSAQSAQELLQGIQGALAAIAARTSTVAAAAVNSYTLQVNQSQVFQTRFNSTDWTGQLRSLSINVQTEIDDENPDWDAASEINQQNWDNRVITTYIASTRTPKPFRWDQLAAPQQAALNINPKTKSADGKGQQRYEFIRGRGAANQDDSWLNTHNFRKRSSQLGDIVHSNPVYVASPIANYPNDLQNNPGFSGFLATYQGRAPIIYVGANDGMLHAFNAGNVTGGQEIMAYVPSKVINKLNALTHPDYGGRITHDYYVDGPPTVGEAYLNPTGWRTVLIAGLRGGGQGVYALDVTDPGSFQPETEAKNRVLWEFNDDTGPDFGDADLGYTYSKPLITRMKGGQWVAIFGNGYNNTENDGSASTTGNAVLYIVSIEQGKLLKKIDTGVGTLQDPTDPDAADKRPNGLATPTVVDIDHDSAADFVYAGDLFGNLWKFDIRGSDPTNWKVAYTASSKPQPLFTALITNNQPQPITTAPVVDSHPLGKGLLIYFGTGKYIENNDNIPTGQITQSVYGIWDKNEMDQNGNLTPLVVFTRTNLLKQQITEELSGFDYSLRLTSDNQISWVSTGLNSPVHMGWYIDLVDPANPASNRGERVVNDPALRNKRLIFTTLMPSKNPCDFGGSSWLMLVDAKDGGRLEETFDLNRDDKFTNLDLVKPVNDSDPNARQAVSGRQPKKTGLIGRPSLLRKGDMLVTVACGATGDCEDQPPPMSPGGEDTGRQSWRQLY